MRDIKSLYLEAKRTGSQKDIDHYMEAVHDLMNNDPLGYISNLEYIISSSSGLQTLHEFVEQNGMPLACVDTLEECLEKCIHKCEVSGKDASEYKKVKEQVQNARSNYDESFAMFGYYSDSLPENYVEAYYGKNDKGIPNRKLIVGMINKFGEACIPDVLLTAKQFGENAVNTVLEYLSTKYGIPTADNQIASQWILESVKNIGPNFSKSTWGEIYNLGAAKVISDMHERQDWLYKESVIMGNDSPMMEYSENEINAIQNLIAIREYQMVSTPDPHRAILFQEEVYALYKELDGLVPDNEKLITERADVKKVAAKKIASNMKALAVKVRKAIIPAIRKEVYNNNSGKSSFNSKRVYNPSIQVTFGDRRGPYTFRFIKGKVRKNLDEILDFSSEWIKGIVIYIQLTTDTAAPIRGPQAEQHWKVFVQAVQTALKDMIKDGEVSLTGDEPNNYVSYLTTWRIPVFMSKTTVIEDVDLDFDESSQEFLEMIADSVIPMLPGEGHDIMEAQWQYNTMNKKTGGIPGYLKNNHDLGYGEEDPPAKKDSDYSLDDFKRPSASKVEPEPLTEPPEEDDEEPDPERTDKPKGGVNNYYYYTYNNSLNRNQGSFNRTRSDDHSIHTSTRDDHSTGKRVRADDVNSHNTNASTPKTSEDPEEDDDTSATEATDEQIEYEFVESSNYYLDEDTYDGHIKKIWFIKSSDGASNCCISVDGYAKAMRGRSTMISLKKENGEWLALIKHKPTGQWEFPGGGWDKGEKPKDAAIRELNEETQTKVKNVKRLGTQIQYNSHKAAVSPWVKKHVKNSDDWWYGYYSAIFIGEEDGKFTGKIAEEDYEDTFTWKPISFIAKKFPHKLITAIEDYIQKEFKESVDTEYISEAVDVRNKKFDKAYKAAFNYENGHLIKITYSLQGCEVTNVGISKAMRDHFASVAEEVNKENHRGSKITKNIRAFMVALKGLIRYKSHINKRKKLLTNFLNENIGDIGYLDFQAKDCKIIEIYDLYTGTVIKDEIPIVGVFAARHMDSGKSKILSDKDLAAVHALIESNKTKFHVSKHKVGDTEVYPTFMSTYWNDKEDHLVVDISNKVIDSDERDRSLDTGLDDIPDLIGDLEMKGFHVSDEEAASWLNKYRSTEKWIPDAVPLETKKENRKFSLYGINFELPPIESKLYHGRDNADDSLKQKADSKMLAMINDPKKLKKIEDQIMKEERSIGEDGDTDETRTERIKKYLSKATIKRYSCTKNGNAIFKMDIPHIKGIICAYEEHEMWITSKGEVSFYDEVEFFEAVGDADDDKPESDHPVKDVLTDIDRELVSKHQKAKKKVQDVQNVGRAFMKPINRTSQWIGNMINQWKDADENNIKERMADPHARKNIFTAIGAAIKYGSLLKAGLLLNPVFLFLSVTKGIGRNKKEFRIRNEMIGEIKTELEIIDEKIKDAERAEDRKAKYQLMRLKNEINKKLLRVGGAKQWKKIL